MLDFHHLNSAGGYKGVIDALGDEETTTSIPGRRARLEYRHIRMHLRNSPGLLAYSTRCRASPRTGLCGTPPCGWCNARPTLIAEKPAT